MHVHRWSKVFISLLIVVAVAGSVVALQPVAAKPTSNNFSATLEPIAGLVQYLPSGASDWQTLTKITLVRQGDQIRTGDLGAARLSTSTGITLEIYPTTLLEIRVLDVASGEAGALTFRISQVVGVTYLNVEQPLKPQDRLEIVTPAALATIHGTRMYTFASRKGDTAFFGDQNRFLASSPIGQTFTNEQDYITFFPMSEPEKVCTIAFLTKNSHGSMLTELLSEGGRKLLATIMRSFLPSNVNKYDTDFLVRFLGLPDGTTNVQDIMNALDNIKPTDMKGFMQDFRSFLRAYFAFLSSNPLSPSTCGNGKQDAGETADNCAVDVKDITKTKGNDLCETVNGESLINDPPDCIPGRGFWETCEDLIDDLLGHPGGNPFKTHVPGPSKTPTRTPTPTPHPISGVHH